MNKQSEKITFESSIFQVTIGRSTVEQANQFQIDLSFEQKSWKGLKISHQGSLCSINRKKFVFFKPFISPSSRTISARITDGQRRSNYLIAPMTSYFLPKSETTFDFKCALYDRMSPFHLVMVCFSHIQISLATFVIRNRKINTVTI